MNIWLFGIWTLRVYFGLMIVENQMEKTVHDEMELGLGFMYRGCHAGPE